MHVLDYDRALGELLELDDTVRATFQKLKDLGELEDTLVVVTADHGHVSLLVSYSLLSVHLLTRPTFANTRASMSSDRPILCTLHLPIRLEPSAQLSVCTSSPDSAVTKFDKAQTQRTTPESLVLRVLVSPLPGSRGTLSLQALLPSQTRGRIVRLYCGPES